MANSDLKTTEMGNGVVLLHFEDAAQPVFVEKKGKPYVLYGEKNDYPNYLLYLYNNSAKHSAIINGKVDYVCGKGWVYDKESTPADQQAAINQFLAIANAKGESLNEVTEKIALDMELFNGAYLQVVWNLLGEIASVYHVDYTTVRSNKDNTEFYVSDEWVKYSPDGTYRTNNNPVYKEFGAFNTNLKKGTQILYIKKYHPGIDIYTLPSYRGSITWIEVDIEIGNYHLNNVKGGFFVNKLINFNNGKPTQEEQGKIEKMFDSKFGGVRGRKYMLAFNADATKAATVLDLNVAESDKLFDQLNKTTQQEIFTGHRITSPILFGIKTEGQLGGRTEIREAYEAFQNIYVNGRQQWLEKVFSMLIKFKGGIAYPLTIQRTEPISFEFSEAIQSQNMTQDEIRERIGLPPAEKKDNSAAQETINAINSLSPLVANKVLENLTSDELRALIGLKPAPTGSIPNTQPLPQQQNHHHFTQEEDEKDIEVFAQFGVAKTERTILKSKKVIFSSDEEEKTYFADETKSMTNLESNILELLNKDPYTTQQIIADTLNIDVIVVNNVLRVLESQGQIVVTHELNNGDETIKRVPIKKATKEAAKKKPFTKTIEVMYSYEGPYDNRNRAFCHKMMELDRLYSRYDIERISDKLGYSVWARRGGWYDGRPYCRHHWEAHVVVDKQVVNNLN
ncbi:winged helix-turn-helix domain-containing protein [Chitinophaga sp.]|uniref:winged helix-turn-helix domain-containing protein n=1 Tax=Chitinophaga sp. TaxID=1869181 RepID=UPI0031DB61D9